MKAKNVVLIVFVALFSTGIVLSAESESAGARAYLGVSLDMQPLPELLTKHLGLPPGQGIRISNIQKDSAADEAGLERDDIIIGFEGKPVENNEQFVEAVREAGIGKEVTLEIIHLGKRKMIKLKLGQFKGEFDWDNWKYPPEPEVMQWWRPGKVFRLRPDEKDWREITLPEVENHLKNLFNEVYSFQHSENGEKYEIVIEGDPEDKDTLITVCFSEPDGKLSQYQAIVNEIDKLPEKYRRPVKEDLEKAVKKSRERKPLSYKGTGTFKLPSPPEPEVWRRYFDAEKLQPVPPIPDNQMFDRMENQLRELQMRIERLEKRQEELLDRLSQQPNKQNLEEQQDKEKTRI